MSYDEKETGTRTGTGTGIGIGTLTGTGTGTLEDKNYSPSSPNFQSENLVIFMNKFGVKG